MMRLLFWSLVVASALSTAWALFLVTMIPLGVCDMIFDPLRSELQRSHTSDEGGRFAGQLCNQLGSVVRSSVLLACVPALATNLLWFVFVGSGRRNGPLTSRGISILRK